MKTSEIIRAAANGDCEAMQQVVALIPRSATQQKVRRRVLIATMNRKKSSRLSRASTTRIGNRHRNWEPLNETLLSGYFADTPIYCIEDFRRKFRM